MIKNIFFDFNGTILDDVQLCFDVEEEIIKEYGLPILTMDFYLDNFCFPVKKYYEKAGFDFSKLSYKVISDKFMSRYLEREGQETRLYPEVKETLKKLKEAGFNLYCYSASEYNILKKQLTNLGIIEYFTDLIASNNIAAKGKLEYGQDYINEHKIDVTKTIMLGDTYHDFEVASALNLKPVLVSFGHNSKKVLSPLNVPIIDNFSKILEIAKHN